MKNVEAARAIAGAANAAVANATPRRTRHLVMLGFFGKNTLKLQFERRAQTIGRGDRQPLMRRAFAAVLVGATSIVAVQAGVTAAGAAGTPAIAVAPKCVINPHPAEGSLMRVAGSGFTAGDSIGLTAGDASGMATASSTGTFDVLIKGPTLDTIGPGAQRFTMTAQDETTGAGSASITFSVANLAFSTTPDVAKPSKVVHFSFSGFKPGASVYAHYLRGRKVVATQRFGRATGVCGLLKAKARLFPLRNPASGTYKVQIDDSRRYRAKALPRVDSTLSITRF
jgi:hypothetical protein